jgi:FdhD protein
MPTVTRRVKVIRDGTPTDETAAVVEERPLTIVLNGAELVTLLTDSSHPRELALGFLRNEGLVERAAQIRRVTLNDQTGEAVVEADVDRALVEHIYGKRMIVSGCGKGSAFYHVLDAINAGRVRLTDEFRIALADLLARAAELADASETYKQTRGVHGAALIDATGVLCFREDIGRHNALDKLAGWLLEQDRTARDLVLYTTGRVTSEVALKAGCMGAPVVLSRAMPTDLALQLGEKMGLTVIGAARGRSAKIFLGAQRLV